MTAIGMEEAISMKATDGDDHKVKVIADDIDDDEELFELDIAFLDGHRPAAAVAGDKEESGGQHALLANCLLPVRSVSKAVPVDASGALSPSYPYYSGYHSSRRLVCFAAGGMMSRRFLGRPGNSNSARFCFSNRGFEAYFQRY